jgi:hypothetical protein
MMNVDISSNHIVVDMLTVAAWSQCPYHIAMDNNLPLVTLADSIWHRSTIFNPGTSQTVQVARYL